MPIIIERIPLDNRSYLASISQLNTCNEWVRTNVEKPADYYDKQKLTQTNQWVWKFHNKDRVRSVELVNVKWMKDAAKVGKITGKFPKLYIEELEDSILQNNKIETMFDMGYFIRTEHTSLKTGMYGIKPYTSLRMVIESIVTCNKTHQALAEDDDKITLYFFPWKNIIDDSECRVFVYNGNITGISCQHWPTENPYLDNKTDDELIDFANRLIEYYNLSIKPKMTITDYTFDIALDNEEKFYFIEPNGFGKDYAAGSSLFEWSKEDSILKGDGSTIVFRI
jgi:hypothetical protein